ncbi:cell wall metabolism sensor histidine kinase WalK [Cellulomonas sp. URHE0023]|uniref:sensor histidine kinase n=1 Tax=Cellulomonas sp. URHE0023 TaxID=1380354 RepID=UPI0006892907|nr:HAMP domain-containing sensor histidine kinase [Cellulomonas sp. URHE0023]
MTNLTANERRVVRRTSWRLGLQVAGLVLVVLAAVSTTVLVIVIRSQHAAGVSQILAAVHSVDDVHDAPAGMWVAVAHHGALETSADMPTGLPDLDALREVAAGGSDVRTTVPTSAGEVTVVTGLSGDRVVQAALDPRTGHEERERLVAALLLAGGLGVVLAGFGGAWLARRAVAPMVGALSLQRRFVADASHELRTPLTLISTRAQLLDRHMTADWGAASPDRVQHDVDGLLADTAALTAVLDDMLLAADARSVDPVPVDVADVAADVVEAARAAGERRGVTLTRSGETRAVVLASTASVRRALTALVDNALDHADGTVEVDVRVGSGRVLVSVRDDGPGLTGDEADLFRRFASHRDEADGDPDRRHYGIGLALVAEIASQHGGSVRAESLPGAGAGAVITLELPAAPRQTGR